MFKTKQKFLSTAKFAGNLTANIFFWLKNARVFFLVDFEQAFYEIFFVWKS